MAGSPRVRDRFTEFFQAEASSGIVLLIATAIAIGIANSPWQAPFADLIKPWTHWINDGLMSVFFFLVGLEIKREVLVGELASARRAALPIFAAIGGMVVPALIYAALNVGQPTMKGWGIPMATDIAFALGVLSLLGNRIPLALKVFLAAVAIVDDLGAVIVIALFYSGIHPTIAGVLLAMVVPRGWLSKIEHVLQPWVSYLIMPIFALANAGVAFSGGSVDRMGIGIAVGLVVGKPIGICLASYLAVKAKVAVLPNGVTWRQLMGAGVLAGIGFTMSLFIAELAFHGAANAKIAILAGSLVAGTVGYALLRRTTSPSR